MSLHSKMNNIKHQQMELGMKVPTVYESFCKTKPGYLAELNVKEKCPTFLYSTGKCYYCIIFNPIRTM